MSQNVALGHSLLAQLDMQPRVRDFLMRALAQGRTSHAYLFLGSPGSGKLDAAWALAQALLCPNGAAPADAPGSIKAVHNRNNSAQKSEVSFDSEPKSAVGGVAAAGGGTAVGGGAAAGGGAAVTPSAAVPDAAGAPAAAPAPAALACGTCDDCRRVSRRTHPDVHYLAPESATGYLINQTRELLEDVALAPIRAKSKVYIIDRAEQLRANTANALLKTLEEPPAGVTFILLGTSADVMLPTIVSRCQCVPFRTLSTGEAVAAVERACGVAPERCRMAVNVTGSPARAIEFLKSPERQEARRAMIRAIDALAHADEADILKSAKELILAVHAPLAEVKSTQQAILEQNQDYLSRGALKQLEDRNKRELSARERSGIMEALASARSLLRDALLVREQASEPIANADAPDVVERIAQRAGTAGITRALDAVAAAEQRVARNVTPQLALEVMLLDIRKALQCL